MKKTIASIISFLTLTASLCAQTYDIDYTVEYINKRTTDVCKLFNEKKNLRIEFYSNGNPVRVDYIFPASIDYENGVEYVESEQSVVVTCYEKAGTCIEREILSLGSRRFYDRSNLQVQCKTEDCQAVQTAMQHLIKLYVLDDYERTQPFEEN